MSWSFQGTGKPEAVLRAIETTNSGLTGQSKGEWEKAKPALRTLIAANVGNVAVEVNASGHATFINDEKTHGQCSVTIRPMYGFVQ